MNIPMLSNFFPQKLVTCFHMNVLTASMPFSLILWEDELYEWTCSRLFNGGSIAHNFFHKCGAIKRLIHLDLQPATKTITTHNEANWLLAWEMWARIVLMRTGYVKNVSWKLNWLYSEAQKIILNNKKKLFCINDQAVLPLVFYCFIYRKFENEICKIEKLHEQFPTYRHRRKDIYDKYSGINYPNPTN